MYHGYIDPSEFPELPEGIEDPTDALPDTARTPKLTPTLVVEEKACVLFISEDYTLEASVSGMVIERSIPSDRPHNEQTKKQWVQQVIHSNAETLGNLGIDIAATYREWGISEQAGK